MEIELTHINFKADIYEVRKAVATVLHGRDLYDPNDKDNKGRLPNFQIVMGKSPAGRIHNGKAILRISSKLGRRLLRWNWESKKNKIVVKGRPLKIFKLVDSLPPDVQQTLETTLYIDPKQDWLRSYIEKQAELVRLRIAKVQFGVWYKPSDSSGRRRTFSVEHERDFLSKSAAYINLVYEHKLIHIDVSATLLNRLQIFLTSPHTQIGQRETEEINYMILVKFSSIRKLGIGYDEGGHACEYPWHLHQHLA